MFVGVLFLFIMTDTLLAIQLSQERIRMLCGNKEDWKCLDMCASDFSQKSQNA